MPTIVFEVNLETVNLFEHKPPFNRDTEGAGVLLGGTTWFQNRLINNRQLKHGDQFTATGLNAVHLQNNYTSGEFKFLDVISINTP